MLLINLAKHPVNLLAMYKAAAPYRMNLATATELSYWLIWSQVMYEVPAFTNNNLNSDHKLFCCLCYIFLYKFKNKKKKWLQEQQPLAKIQGELQALPADKKNEIKI